jgi:hypothetical protein
LHSAEVRLKGPSPFPVTRDKSHRDCMSSFLSLIDPKLLGGQQPRDLLGIPTVTTCGGPHAARFKLLGDGCQLVLPVRRISAIIARVVGIGLAPFGPGFPGLLALNDQVAP